MNWRCVAMIVCLWTGESLRAGIPEAPAVLYGRVFLNGQQVRATDDVTILARVDEASLPIGEYRMGSTPAAGDNYVLRIRIESLFDGLPQSQDAGVVGQTARLLLKTSDGEEHEAMRYPLTRSASIEAVDLRSDDGCTGGERIASAKCVDRSGSLLLTVKLAQGVPGDAFQIVLSTGGSKSGTINSRGKGKAKFKNRSSGESGTATATWGCGVVRTKDYACP